MSAPRSPDSASATPYNEKEIIELAWQEGHDADIPSNAGFVAEDSAKDADSFSGSADRDLEKGGKPGSVNSSTVEESKITHTADIEECQPSSTVEPTAADPDVVDWDGPDDPANPMNFSGKVKVIHIAILSLLTLVTPLASSMFAPGVPEVMRDFKTDSATLASFVVSVYILGFAFGPLAVAPMSELYGRYWIYTICNALFIIFTVACALAQNMAQLCVFRFFAGAFGVAPITIGSGTIADMIAPQKRGGAMAIWAIGPLLGPVIGPVAGGYLSVAAGWRWVFWTLAIVSGVCCICCFFFTRETYAPVLLARKAAKLRKETGNTALHSKLDNGLSPRDLFKRSIVRPTKMLLLSPIVAAMSVYMAVAYGIMYLLFTTFTFVFIDYYGFTESNVGLVYIGTGIGMLLGLVVLGAVSDKLSLRLAAKNGGEMKPEYRLPPLIIAGPFIPAGLFIYGWGADKHVQWALPLFGTLLVGIGMIGLFMCIQTYLVDAFTIHAASAIAANTVLRSIVGAILPLCGLRMYDALGLGWGNSLIGFIALALVPIPVLFYKYGEAIRRRTKVKL
ncbi:hypothetical protein H2203_003986 [Taxawa tesnikishii (nom. ined.)]|nr:hypothetical protein H2203_003986 [Dothideales sp. JES 119]